MRNLNLFLLLSFTCSASAIASDITYDDLKISSQLASVVYCETREGTQEECNKNYIIRGEPLTINWFHNSNAANSNGVVGTGNSTVNNTYHESTQFWRELEEADLNSRNNTNTLRNANDDFQTLTIYDPKNNIAYVAFRGSDNLVNWLGNILVNPTAFEEDSSSMVHFGFYQYLLFSLAARNDDNLSLQNWLTQIETNYKPTYVITGHSLGGAGAVLLAAKFINSGLPAERIKLITYGQPAPGTWGFLSKYQSKIKNYVRVANIGNPTYVSAIMGDPVVAATGAFKYYQFGKLYIIAIDTNYSIYEKLQGYSDSLKYPLSLHDSFNYTDFVTGCNLLSETCEPQLRGTTMPQLSPGKVK